jgi:hypothetical protein
MSLGSRFPDLSKEHVAFTFKGLEVREYLCYDDRASLYNLVNRTNLVHSLLPLVYSSISTCFGRLWAQHKEKKLCFRDTWYLLFCVDDCLVCRVG